MSNNTSSNNNLVIYQKYLELLYYTIEIVKKYPKSETFALAKEIKSTIYNGLRLLIYAIKSYNKQDKLKFLNEFDISLNLLKIHIRISYKYKYISLQNYNTWSGHITNICNMLGGWISSCLKRWKTAFMINLHLAIF